MAIIFNYLVGDVASNSQGDLIISACFDFLTFEYGNSLPTIPSSMQTGFLNYFGLTFIKPNVESIPKILKPRNFYGPNSNLRAFFLNALLQKYLHTLLWLTLLCSNSGQY